MRFYVVQVETIVAFSNNFKLTRNREDDSGKKSKKKKKKKKKKDPEDTTKPPEQPKGPSYSIKELKRLQGLTVSFNQPSAPIDKKPEPTRETKFDNSVKELIGSGGEESGIFKF